MIWCLDSVFREIYTCLPDFFYWTKYHRKLEQVAEPVSCQKFARGLQFYKKSVRCICFDVTFVKFFRTPVAPVVFFLLNSFNPANSFLLKVNDRNTRNVRRRNWRCSGVFIANFGHNLNVFLVFLLLSLNK